MDSGGGLMSTAKALVQFASRYPVQGIGKERVINSRNGAMPGTNSVVYSHPSDKIDYAFIFNTSNEIPGPRVNLTSKNQRLFGYKTIPMMKLYLTLTRTRGLHENIWRNP